MKRRPRHRPTSGFAVTAARAVLSPLRGMEARARRRLAGGVVALLLTWVVGYPLLLTLLEALGIPLDFTVEHFAAFAQRGDEWQALWRSLWISAASVALAALVGVPLAFVFARLEFPGPADARRPDRPAGGAAAAGRGDRLPLPVR